MDTIKTIRAKKKKFIPPKEVHPPNFENAYDKIVIPKIDRPRHYPGEDRVKISIPFRMVISGTTGSGKTTFLKNLIEFMPCFTKFYFFCKVLDEPLYRDWLETLQKAGQMLDNVCVEAFEDLEKLSEVKFDKHQNSLVIVDDQIHASRAAQATAADLWIKGRKSFISCIWLTQSFYRTDKTIRDNTGLLALKEILDKTTLKEILRRSGIAQEFSSEQLYGLAKDIIERNNGTLLIDKTPRIPEEYRIRMNLSPIDLPSYFQNLNET